MTAAAALLLYGCFLIIPSLAFVATCNQVANENACFGLFIAWPAIGIGGLFAILAGLTFAGRLRRAPAVVGLVLLVLFALVFGSFGEFFGGLTAVAATIVGLAVFEGLPTRVWRWVNYDNDDV